MGNVPRPNIIWRGAHPLNFTVGRPNGGRDGRNTQHHVVGSAESAVIVFNNGSRGASAHFVVTDQPDTIFQCVDINNTAWADGNWDSNLRTVSVEHHGDWRFGFDNPVVRENSAKLAAYLRDQGIVSYTIRHRDVKPTTQCSGDLPIEAIWNRATEIINYYNQPVDNRPEWMKNRREVPGRQVYAQVAGIFVHNLNDPGKPLDSRRFVLNQNFDVKGETTAGGKEYWITRSSYDGNVASGLLKSDVAESPFVPPAPVPQPVPQPTTPDWADSLLVDDTNKEMYVLRATPLVDLENGRPVIKNGSEVWFQAGDIIKDVSAHTVVSGVTYELTEYSFSKIKSGDYAVFGNGIKASDLSVDPKAAPEGTPANPRLPQAPTDPIEDMPDVPTPAPLPDPVLEQPTMPEIPVTDAPQDSSTPKPSLPKLSLWTKLMLLILRIVQARVEKKLK